MEFSIESPHFSERIRGGDMKKLFPSNERKTSVSIAKERLKLLLVSDHANCTPDIFEKLKEELYFTVSKYIEVAPESFDVGVSQSKIFIELSRECQEQSEDKT